MYINRIKNLCLEKNVSLKELAENIGITYQGLNKCIRKNNMQCSDLEKVTIFLGVPVSYFFEEGVTGGSGVEKNFNHSQINYQQGDGNKNAQHVGDGCVECGRLRREVESLHELLKAKDEIINLLKERK